jgi:hypothetical protein
VASLDAVLRIEAVESNAASTDASAASGPDYSNIIDREVRIRELGVGTVASALPTVKARGGGPSTALIGFGRARIATWKVFAPAQA